MPQLKGPHIKLAGIELGIYYTIYILYTLQIGVHSTGKYVLCSMYIVDYTGSELGLHTVYYTDGVCRMNKGCSVMLI